MPQRTIKRLLSPPFAALRAFDAYGRTGGIRRAAELLGVSHPIVSRQIRALEEWLDVALLDARRSALTAAGADYHARVSAALDGLGDATAAILQTSSPRLEIWCSPGLASLWLANRIGEFGRQHPAIALDLRPADSPPDLRNRQADADLRYVRDDYAGQDTPLLRTAVLARPRVFPVASPVFADRYAAAVGEPADLIDLPLLQEDGPGDWLAWFRAHEVPRALPAPVLRLWHAQAAIEAARAGHGIALSNDFLSQADLEAGRLVELGLDCPAFLAVEMGAYVLTASASAWDRAPLTAFRSWILLMMTAAN